MSSTATTEMQVDTPSVDKVSSEKSQHPKAKRRGMKPSSKKRFEAFREKVSQNVTKEIHAAASAQVEISVDRLSEALEMLKLIQQRQTAVVPVTTRGVGFNVNESYEEAKIQCPKAVANCTVQQAYRAGLAQFEAQTSIAQKIGGELTDPALINESLVAPLTTDSLDVITPRTASFKSVADLVNNVGLSKNPIGSTLAVVQPLTPYQQETDEPPAAKRKRDDVKFRPEPHLVMFSNLRATVVALADPDTPQADREYFRSRNPIPGARFNDDCLLTNGDTIMPASYDLGGLTRDLRAYEALLSLLGSKCAHLVGQCTFNGYGSDAIYVNCGDVPIRLEDTNLHQSPEASGWRYRCARPLDTPLLLRGALGILGEVPPKSGTLYGVRMPYHTVGYIDVTWSSLFAQVIKRG